MIFEDEEEWEEEKHPSNYDDDDELRKKIYAFLSFFSIHYDLTNEYPNDEAKEEFLEDILKYKNADKIVGEWRAMLKAHIEEAEVSLRSKVSNEDTAKQFKRLEILRMQLNSLTP